jgi:serine/threonine protein kinase
VSRETDPVLPGSGMTGKIANYRLDGYVGRGSMAVVHLARDERLDRTVALKILAPDLASDAAFRTRFLHESQAAAAVDHPNIIPVYEVGDAGGILFVAMRYAQGGDARSLLNRLGPLPFGLAWSIIAQVAAALDAAHGHGLIHRDVKPTNMLLDAGGPAGGNAPRRADAGGDFGHVYLSDFGISRNPPGDPAAMGQLAGTLDYVAPEQVEGRAVDGRADLYSLACAGFELLCGMPPFGQDQGLTVMYAQLYAPPPTASARRPDLPAAADLVLATALAKNPADRYATCRQFAEELGAALGLPPGQPETPAGPSRPGHLAPVADAGPVRAGREPAEEAWVAGVAGVGRMAETPETAGMGGVAETPETAGMGGMGAAGVAGMPGIAETPETARTTWTGGVAGVAGAHDFEYRPAAAPVSPPYGRDWSPSPPEQSPVSPPYGRGWPSSPPEQSPVSPPYGRGLSPSPPEQPLARPQWPRKGPISRPGRPGSRPHGQRPSRTRLIVAAAAAAVVVAVALGLSKGSAPGTPAPRAASSVPSSSALAFRQAAAVRTLLGSSAATRKGLVVALTEVHDCRHLPRAIGRIQQVVDQRSAEYAHASALSTAAMAKGAIVKSDLLAALRHSLEADRDYLTWARQRLDSGCTPAARSTAYRAAENADRQADASKAAFVQVWNSVAARYGVQRTQPGDI